MKTNSQLTAIALLLVFLLASFTVGAADAGAAGRNSKGGSTPDALGEEFPEITGWPVLIGLEFPLWQVFVWWDGLGEEFPEKTADTHPTTGLGEEFPE
ncbi:MAG: hypothetical protein KA123_02645 [Candidatus Eisenbacteria bacterium]|nr:hypothetical protein [Candidatus Eisenbacteria bacterium]